jgi:hypothetical protein
MSKYSNLGWAKEREQGRREGGVGFVKLILSKGLVELGCVAAFAGFTPGKGARGNPFGVGVHCFVARRL